MMCNCKIWGIILSAIILVFALWESTISWLSSKLVITIAAIILLLYNLGSTCTCHTKDKPIVRAKSRAISRSRRRRR